MVCSDALSEGVSRTSRRLSPCWWYSVVPLSGRKELTADARELKGELYCLPCHDKMGVPICGACRRPIEGRVVNAMGKQWHVEVSACGGVMGPSHTQGSGVPARLGDAEGRVRPLGDSQLCGKLRT